MNAISHKLIIVTNDFCFNAQSLCDLLHKLAALNLGVPITLFLDNAPYQKRALVQTLATSLIAGAT